MIRWLIGSLLAGVPSGFGEEHLDALAGSGGTRGLATALDARVAHLLDAPDPVLGREAIALLGPLAERVGRSDQRARLEDAGFRATDPVRYAALAALAGGRDAERLAEVMEVASAALGAAGIDGALEGRVKSLYSTARKMDRKALAFHAVADRIAARVIVEGDADAYHLLDALHARHAHLPSELDDYIATPRPSGYRALHTALRLPGGVAEIQIRTADAHAEAESGAAAHWRYKLATPAA